jgi:diamine N-acetyltransferase
MKRSLAPFGDSRILLRLLQEDDLDQTLGWRNRDEVRKWFKTANVISRAQHHEWFKAYSTKDDDFVFVILADGVPAGQVSLYRVDWEAGQAEVGRFIVAPELQGNGIFRWAFRHLIDYSFDQLMLRYLYLEVMAENRRAIRAYANSGFVEEHTSDGFVRMGRWKPFA